MKKLSKIISLCLVCAVAIGCAVYFSPSSSAEAESITKNLWSIDDSYLSDAQNVKLDTVPNKKTDTVDFDSSGSGVGATSNISVVNGATYTASCIYSFDGYEATFRRVAFFVYCYDRDGNKMTSAGLINGLDYESSYTAYGSPDIGYSSSLTDYQYSVNFTINSINISYIAVKFGVYASSLQTGLTIKFPMVELGNTKTDYVKSDKGYTSGYSEAFEKYIARSDTFLLSTISISDGLTNDYDFNSLSYSVQSLDYLNGSNGNFASGLYYTKYSIINNVIILSDGIQCNNYSDFLKLLHNGNIYGRYMQTQLWVFRPCTTENMDKLFSSWYDMGKNSAEFSLKQESYNKGYQDGLKDGEGALSIGVGTASTLFSGMADLLNVKVFGTVPLGAFLGIPLLFGLILFVLKIVRG